MRGFLCWVEELIVFLFYFLTFLDFIIITPLHDDFDSAIRRYCDTITNYAAISSPIYPRRDNNNNNAAVSQLLGSRQAWVGLGVGALVSVLGGVFTLL